MTDCSTWTIETLRSFYDERLAENQRRSDERYNQLLDNMQRDRETFDRRMEGANRYKETYTDSLNRIANETVKRGEFETKFTSFAEKLDMLGKTNWPIYIGFATVAVSAIYGLWVIIGMKIDQVNQPLAVSMAQIQLADTQRDRSVADLRSEFVHQNSVNDADASQRSRDISTLLQNTEAGKTDRGQLNERVRAIETQVVASRTADANSSTDRGQLNERLRAIENAMSTNMADRKSVEAGLKASLVEVETQFCASDQIRNLMHANDLRVQSVLWQHAGSLGDYPTANAYYPSICNRDVKAK